MSKNQIVLCELYHDFLHGDETMCGQYLVIETFTDLFEKEEELDSESDSDSESNSDSNSDSDSKESELESKYLLELCTELHREKYIDLFENPRFTAYKHKSIRNYHDIVRHPLYIQPQIAHCFYLHGRNETICILKTFWLRLVQRRWKHVFQRRKWMVEHNVRFSIADLKYREIYGRWSDDKPVLPSLKGMLSSLCK